MVVDGCGSLWEALARVRTLEHGQQFGLVGMQPREQTIEGDEAGAAAKDAVEAGAKPAAATWRRVGAVSFQIGVEPPDRRTDTLLRDTLVIGESVELVHQPLGMDPAQRVLADGELAGIVADSHRVTQKFMRMNAAPQRALGGDLHRVGSDSKRGDAQPFKVHPASPSDRQTVCRGAPRAGQRWGPARACSRMLCDSSGGR